jgi:hypothetical protein
MSTAPLLHRLGLYNPGEIMFSQRLVEPHFSACFLKHQVDCFNPAWDSTMFLIPLSVQLPKTRKFDKNHQNQKATQG